MTPTTLSAARPSARLRKAEANARPLVTIFTVLKPFVGEADTHQRNALASWQMLGPDVEILLFSDTSIPDDLRARFTCLPCIATNELGTPLLDDVFRVAADIARGSVRAFVNGDIVLDQRFTHSVRRLQDSDLASWLAIGQRTELDVPAAVQHPAAGWLDDCFQKCETQGELASVVCKDYFIFTADLFQDLPAFAIGRGNWDNWMVAHSKSNGIPVVDITAVAPVIHQRHGYAHVSGGRGAVYVSGPEAKENQRLAGGRHLISGSTANWRFDKSGIRRVRWTSWTLCKDAFRFAGLLLRMLMRSD
ncbi:hypothetical protein Poly24_52440 [Rosistilla carotiformis]|uniref:Glycosyl transferase family 2 n=1 Tax=Rosistilla carotiformis TaxID=2528017 RepID=A0A518K140_9BACT|nr:hypothetical protein [Rosistilla carotiformis]QDV71507.1 hypothetical protein Poly24_52440 [Rosistilla carotiformis]